MCDAMLLYAMQHTRQVGQVINNLVVIILSQLSLRINLSIGRLSHPSLLVLELELYVCVSYLPYLATIV